jgi:large subunit ribosomal protein L4
MPKFKVYNMAGEVTGEVELSEAIFGITPNKEALHESVKNHLANMRQGTQSALTRAEVSGGGAKPFRQKGTGRARQGSTRAPHYTHGGIAFAPKPRDYSYTINKKLKRLALKSALSQKAIDQAIVVVDSIEMDHIKTKDFVKFLGAVGVSGKALVVTPEVRDTVVKSANNLPGVQTTIATILSAYDIMNAKTFVVDKAALATIEEVYA